MLHGVGTLEPALSYDDLLSIDKPSLARLVLVKLLSYQKRPSSPGETPFPKTPQIHITDQTGTDTFQAFSMRFKENVIRFKVKVICLNDKVIRFSLEVKRFKKIMKSVKERRPRF